MNVTVAAGCLELEVSDDGRGATPDHDNRRDPGHGLVGMSERVRLYGGELYAGRRTDTRGFEVRARIPLDASGPRPTRSPRRPAAMRLPVAHDRGLRWRWLDPACAGVLLVALEIGVLTGGHRHGPLALNMLAVAAVALAAVWRRRSPLLFLARRRGARGGHERVPHDA